MTSADVTLRALSLGAQDSTTGWYAKSYAESTIKMPILPKGNIFRMGAAGWYAKYPLTGFAVDGVNEGDEIKDSNDVYYRVEAVEEQWFLNNFSHRICSLVKVPVHGDRAATSGTWDTTPDDAVHRHKVLLDTYLTAANMKKDNGSTNATTITQYAYPDYPLTKVFDPNGKAVDAIFSIAKPTSKPAEVDWDGTIISYHEAVPVTIHVMNKPTVTAVNLLHSCENELRRIAETYPISTSYRSLQTMKEADVDLRNEAIWSAEYLWTYQRDTTT